MPEPPAMLNARSRGHVRAVLKSGTSLTFTYERRANGWINASHARRLRLRFGAGPEPATVQVEENPGGGKWRAADKLVIHFLMLLAGAPIEPTPAPTRPQADDEDEPD